MCLPGGSKYALFFAEGWDEKAVSIFHDILSGNK